MKRLIPIVVATLLLAGCAGSPTPSASPTPTPTIEASTVEQWASVVAQQKAEWDEWQSGWEAESCSSLSIEYFPCGVQLMTATFMTQTTKITFEGATMDTAGQFIAEAPPKEIGPLWTSTVDAAIAAESASAAWTVSGCDAEPSGTACIGTAFDFTSAIDKLNSEFSAWAPYI